MTTVITEHSADWLPAVFGLLGALVGGLFTLGGVWFQQSRSREEAEKQFERQRQLDAEQHSRDVTEAQSRELSAILDHNLSQGDALIHVYEALGGVLSSMSQDERTAAVSTMTERYGLTDQSQFLIADALENEPLREFTRVHWEKCRELEMLIEIPQPVDSLAKLADLATVRELQKEIALTRRQLRRAAQPL